jgi:hypothetical protein
LHQTVTLTKPQFKEIVRDIKVDNDRRTVLQVRVRVRARARARARVRG